MAVCWKHLLFKSLCVQVLMLVMCMTFTRAITKMTVQEGSSVTMKCNSKVPKNLQLKIIWQSTAYSKDINVFDYTISGGIKSVSSFYRGRVELANKMDLKILQVNRNDIGKYECHVLYYDAKFKTAKTQLLLIVEAPPRIMFKDVPIRSLRVNKTFWVTAKADGYPTPKLSWLKDGNSLPTQGVKDHGNGTLEITAVSRIVQGIYSCVATNKVATAVSNFSVSVDLPARIFGKTRYHANVGETASLICKSDGMPLPTVKWRFTFQRMKMELHESDGVYERFQVTNYNDASSTQSVLTISNVKTSDWKSYSCFVFNTFGKDNATIQLLGYTNPEPPTILRVETQATTAKIEWKFNDNGGTDLTSLTLEYMKASGSEWSSLQIKPPNLKSYTIMELDSDTNYKFRMFATNKVGRSEGSDTYMTKTQVGGLESDGNSLGLGSLDNISMTALIGGVAGGFLALLIAITCVFILIRKLQKGGNNNQTPSTSPSNSRPGSTAQQPELVMSMDTVYGSESGSIRHPMATPDELELATFNSKWEFPRDRLRLSRVLGCGAFGVVMRADAEGIKGCSGELSVAVKVVKENHNEKAKKDLLAELHLLKLIEPHPNVISLLGCCTRQEPLMLIVEYCSSGDLQGFLRSSRGIYDKDYMATYNCKVKSLVPKDLLSFAMQIAQGMAHLASMKVIHRDLAARNILVTEDKKCKVSDFGFARDIYVEDHYTRTSQGGRFPIKWMAIESLLDGISIAQSDVWSFGVLLWEIVTLGASPYPGMNSAEVVSFLQDGYRMDKPKHCYDELYKIMMDCWQVVPQRRPTFVELSRIFGQFVQDNKEYMNMKSYEDQLYINFDITTGTNTGTGTEFNPSSSSLHV